MSFNLIKKPDAPSSPEVSILMSVYNGEKYLKRAIKSILNQTIENIELIAVNDGSTDNSISILKEFQEQDSRVVIIDQENIGLTKSLNIGISQARGKFIARQDADDESLPSRLETQKRLLIEYKLDLITARAIKNDSKVVPNTLTIFFRKMITLLAGNKFIHGTYFGSKEFFDEIKYNEKYKYAQDYRFILDCMVKNKKVGVIQTPLYKVFDHKENISNANNRVQIELGLSALEDVYGDNKGLKFIESFSNPLLRNVVRFAYNAYLYFFSKEKSKYLIVSD